MAILNPKQGIPFFVSASSPHLTSLSIIHNLQSSVNWCKLALHFMHQCPAIELFPRALAWKAKSPITKTSVVGMWLGVVIGIWLWQQYSSTSVPPLLSLNICSLNLDTFSSPAVNLGSMFLQVDAPYPYGIEACIPTP
jgi:hypothetical protein